MLENDGTSLKRAKTDVASDPTAVTTTESPAADLGQQRHGNSIKDEDGEAATEEPHSVGGAGGETDGDGIVPSSESTPVLPELSAAEKAAYEGVSTGPVAAPLSAPAVPGRLDQVASEIATIATDLPLPAEGAATSNATVTSSNSSGVGIIAAPGAAAGNGDGVTVDEIADPATTATPARRRGPSSSSSRSPSTLNHRATVDKLSTLFARLRREGYTGRRLWDLLRTLYYRTTPADSTVSLSEAEAATSGATFADIARRLVNPMLHAAEELYGRIPHVYYERQHRTLREFTRHFRSEVLGCSVTGSNEGERFQLLARVFHYCSHMVRVDGTVIDGSVLPDELIEGRFTIPAGCCAAEVAAAAAVTVEGGAASSGGGGSSNKKRGRGE